MSRQADFDPAIIAALVQRVFPSAGCRFARTETGGSTPVYRVWRGDEVFYLRLAETPEASLLPEVQVHTRLREVGARVPEIVYFDPFDETIQRSIMMTGEIRGDHIGNLPVDGAALAIVREAGRDLALINSIPVAGFGWIRRDTPSDRLQAEHATLRDWAVEYLDACLTLLDTRILSTTEIATIVR